MVYAAPTGWRQKSGPNAVTGAEDMMGSIWFSWIGMVTAATLVIILFVVLIRYFIR